MKRPSNFFSQHAIQNKTVIHINDKRPHFGNVANL